MAQHALLTILLLLAAAASATGQSRPARIAHEFCSAYVGEIGYETRCEIYISDDLGNTVRLMEAAQPSWSPDGRRLVAVMGDVLLFNLADNTIANLTNRPAQYLAPRWSPDGTRIAFISDRSSQWELYAMNADGSAPTTLTASLWSLLDFSWSPDGTAIAFGATINGQSDLYVVELDGLNRRRVTSNANVKGSPPSWSSDGARIAFDCGNDICTVNADGSAFRTLTSDPAGSFGAVFSPVDGRIAFTKGEEGALGLAVIDSNGVVSSIAPSLRAKRPTWSPSGEWLLFGHTPERDYACPADGSCVDNDVLYIVASDGTGLRTAFGGQNPQWAPAPAGRPFATFAQTCTGSTCQFDASGSSDAGSTIASYYWTFGDGTVRSTSSVPHTYGLGGTYYVTLTVTDNNGASDIAVKKVFANTPPVPSFTVTCSGPTCTFDASASHDSDGSITAHTWIFGDGSAGEGRIVTHVYPTGTFTATLFVGDNSGDVVSADRSVSAVNAPPVASFTVSCTDLTCSFDASASTDDVGQIWNYQIDPGNGAPGPSNNGPLATYTYAAPGTYTATLTVRDGAGQTSSTSRSLTVTAPTMHIGDLDGTRYVAQQTWEAYVAIQVHRETHQPTAPSATVSGTWNDGTAASCTTDGTGWCYLQKYGLSKKVASVTFTVKNITHGTFVYKPAGNHDPEADSNGTIIKIARQ